jgi:VTC domain-containing protein
VRVGLPSAAAALLSAFFFLLGAAAVAHADPTFVLTQSGAAPGDSVHFSISGTEGRATYSLEVDGEELGEGSVPEDSGVSGTFTMPDLGNTSRAVTVEAQITQSDETMTRERSLQYHPPSQASAGPTAPQAAPVLTSAPAAQATPASASGPRSQQRNRPASGPAPAKRRARGPRRARERHVGKRPASEPQRSTRAGHHPHRHGSPAASASKASARSASTARSEGQERAPSAAGSGNGPPNGPRESVGSELKRGLTTFLTVPPTPALFSAASEVVTGSGSGGFPVTSLMILTLLGISALTLAGGGLAPKRRPPRVRRREADRFASANGRPASTPALPEDREAFGTKQNGQAVLPEEVAVPLQEVAASFAPIGLAVLDDQAALATRSERKYVLDVRTFERLISQLIPHYLILEIEGVRVFPYDTVYFDTPAWTTYRQHLQERRRRFKVRTRLYSASGPCFFEVKLKGGRGQTIKRRIEREVEEHGSLTWPALAFLERELQRAYGASPPDALAPALRTSYRRLTLAGRAGAERLTFDFERTATNTRFTPAVSCSRPRPTSTPERPMGARGRQEGCFDDLACARLGVAASTASAWRSPIPSCATTSFGP